VTWVEDLRVQAAALGPRWLEVLRAFGGDDPGPGGDPGGVAARIPAVLSQEVDRDQAELFGRRYRQVQQLLSHLPPAEGRWLSRFLRHRAHGILGAPGPRALRIRALVDYVFSQAAVVAHDEPGAPSLEEVASGVSWRPVAAGVEHARLEGTARDFGPVHVNLLRLRGVRLRALDARPAGDLVAMAAAHGAVAAFSGGFFLYSEPDIAPPSRRTDPVGLLVSGGEVVGPPVFRRGAVVQRRDGSLSVEVVSLHGREVRLGATVVRPDAVYNRAHGLQAPDVLGAAIVGRRVVAVGRALPIPLAGVVVPLPAGASVAPGDVAEVALSDVVEAVGGGPMLLGPGALDLRAEDFAGTAPPVTFSQDETFDTNLLPRLGVGVTADGALVVAAVDGRNFDRAPGLTLRGTARLLAALGCEVAVNLDGGSSKRMVVGGRIVDLPSTEVVSGAAGERVRPVHSAVLVTAAWQDPGKEATSGGLGR
jgi:hypothetical protein